jgi:hypothetical protein
MMPGTAPNRENCTLTDAELAACQPVAGEGGQVLRAFCPFHGSDHQRSLRVQVHSGRFVCFACGAWAICGGTRALAGGAAAAGDRPAAWGAFAAGAAAASSRARTQPTCTAPRDTARSCARVARPGAAPHHVPGCPPGEPGRRIPAAAWHSPGARAAVWGGLCRARHLAPSIPRLARRPCGLSAHDAGGTSGESVWLLGLQRRFPRRCAMTTSLATRVFQRGGVVRGHRAPLCL